MKLLKYSWLEINSGLGEQGNMNSWLVVISTKITEFLFPFFFDSSRLGCQICVTKDFKGITLRIPQAHRDVRDL